MGQKVLDGFVAPVAAKDQRKHARADEDDKDHGVDLGGGTHGFFEGVAVEVPLGHCQEHGTHRADRSGLGRRGHPEEDGAEHPADEDEGRHEGRAEAGEEGRVEGLALLGRHGGRLEEAEADYIEDIETHQHETGQERAHKEVADRHGDRGEIAHFELGLLMSRRDDVAEDDEHNTGRDDLAERPRGADDAGGNRWGVRALEHGRQRNKPHGDDRRADDAGGSRQQPPDEAHRNPQPPAQAAAELRHGFEQVLGDL